LGLQRPRIALHAGPRRCPRRAGGGRCRGR
jgi:hypothetical protein